MDGRLPLDARLQFVGCVGPELLIQVDSQLGDVSLQPDDVPFQVDDMLLQARHTALVVFDVIAKFQFRRAGGHQASAN